VKEAATAAPGSNVTAVPGEEQSAAETNGIQLDSVNELPAATTADETTTAEDSEVILL